MIRYSLKCPDGHKFESWFKNASAYDGLMTSGLVTCPECGSSKVEKAIMSPQITPARTKNTKTLSQPQTPEQTAMAKLRQKVEAESEYVGMQFATEARAMHLGDTPERAIYGEAKPEEAKKLIEDGIPVAPLPFTPTRKTN